MATKPKVGQIAATKPRFEYVDVDRSQLTGARFYDDSPVVAETEAPEARGALRGVADVGLELGSGAIKGVKFMSDALGADNPVSGALADVNNYVKSLQSAQAKGEDQKIAAIMKEAEDKGVWEQVKAAFSGAGEAPIRQSVGALATGLPIMAASMIPGVREASWGARLATMGSLGATQGAGIVKSTIYDEVKQRALQEGKSETEAQALASKAQAYSGENFDQIAMGAGLNAAASMTGFQPAVVKAVSGEAGKGAARGLIGSTALGVLKEVPFEAAQGGQEQVAGNVAQDRAGFATPTFRGAVGAMTMEGLLAAPGGAVGGALDYSAPAQLPAPIKTPEQSAADAIRAAETVPESGPMTRASNAATEAKARAIEAGAPLVDEQATAEPMPEPVDDPVRDQILALPDGARQNALRAYAVVNRTDVAKGVQQYNRKLLDRLLAENAPPPVLGESLTGTDMGAMLGGGGLAGNADPLAGALGMSRESQANSVTNVARAAESRPPIPASDAARMLDEARNQGVELAVAEHPSGGFVLVPPQWVSPDVAAQGETRLAETIARMQQADGAPVERAPRTRTDAADLSLPTDPVQNYMDTLRTVNTPAARAYVRDFDAGRITPTNVQQRMVAEQGKTPGQRIAQAAAEAPAQTDPVAERLARAAAQGAAVPAPTDILNPVGLPFKTRMAADRAAKQTPGAVVPVEGGFVVRPQEPVNVQDVPQAPEVPQAAPAVSPPSQAPQAVGAQPAGPAAGVPAAGAGAVEAAGVAPATTRIGRDQTPLSEGGKPFKTRKAAGDAKKLQPMMRVVMVPGGYALADKTPAQLAAEAKAAKRLATPRTSARGEPIPAHAFVAAAGGLNPVAASDLGVDGNPRIGNRRLFSGQGRGLSMDQATQMLVADGYLGEGATVNDAFALIKRSLTQPQYNADGIERIAEAESTAQFEDYLAAQEEVAQDDEFDPFGPARVSLDGFSDDMLESSGYDAATDAIKAEVRALLEMAAAQGIDTESIMLEAHEQTRNATEQDYYEAAKSALEAAITGSNRDRGTPAGSESQGPGAAAASAEDQGLNKPAALDQKAQEATENVAPAVSTTVEMPPTRQQESSPYSRFAAGRYRIDIKDDGNARYAEVVALQRARGVEVELRLPSEALEHPAFSQLNARAQALFETPTANMFDSEPAALELAAQTPAEAAARQEEAEQAEKAQAAAKRATDAAAKAEDERKRIAQASVRAADRFELGQDPMDSLTGQGSVFDAQEPEQQAPKATETVAAQPDTKNSTKPIEDAGEKIGGARKDRWKERGLNLDDLDAMTEAEGAELATKANVWKPDYEALSEASEPVTAAMVKTIYDQLAAKPKKNTPDGRRQYVQMMRIVRDVLTEAKGPDAVRNAYLEIRGRAGLNSALPAEKSAGRELMFSVYKGRSDPFVLGGADLMKAKKMVEDGFPAKADPWKTRLVVGRAEGGPGTTERGIEIYMERSAEVGTPLTREQILAGFYRVSTKDNKAVAFAASKADAEAAAATVYERDMKGKKDAKPEPVRPNLDELKRENLPKRIDRDVKADDFVNDLGFRGIEFGNWSAQDERQRILNMAYDGLMDLAEIMGVPPKAMSLNGTLGMAFGARGGGRFAAHYEPGKLVINMTKIRGGGSMAHEWAHAMDHYFGEMDKPDAYTTQARGASGWYSEDQYLGVPRKRMERVGNEWKNVEKMRLDNLRPEMAAAFDEVMRGLFKKQITKAEMVRSLELDLERTEALARSEQVSDLKAMYQNMVQNKRQALNEMRGDPEGTMYAGRGRTDYANQAQALSGKSVDGYWVRPTEMFARAFESWVFDRVTAMGAKSDYLVHGVEEDRFAGGAYKGNPYPTGEERARINAAFDKLAGTIKTKDTDKGVAMFSRRSASGNRLPDVVIGHKLGSLSSHPDYEAAKAGDSMAAARIASDLVDDAMVEAVRRAAGNAELIVPVVSVEATGRNKIPLAVARELADRLGSTAETEIVQADSPKRTSMDGLSRLLNPPVFDGPVTQGAAYVLVDDTVTQGGTFASLASHIRDNGGEVAGVVALTGKQYSAKLEPSSELLQQVRDRFQSVEPAFRSATGYGFDALTESEARYLVKHDDAESVRNRILAAGSERVDGGDRGLPQAFARQQSSAAPADSNARNVATQLLVDGLKAKWTRAPEIIVARNMQDAQIPQRVRDHDAMLKSQGATGEARGFIYQGKVYLLSDQLNGPEQIAEVLFHEVLGHHGLRGAFGDALTPILEQIAGLRGKEMNAKAKEYGFDLSDRAQRLQAAEEVLAEMAQSTPEIGYVQRAIAAIRTWLRANVPGFKSLALTDAEIVRSYILPARGWVERGAQAASAAPVGQRAFEPAFSLNEDVGKKALAEFAKADELFALPKSTKDTVEGIAADVDPKLNVRVTRLPGETMYTLTHPDMGVARITERSGNPYGPSLYGYNQVDGEITDQVTERPGENPEDVDPRTGDVWLDVSLLKPGGGGDKIYAIAANYAHNTGKIFIGDPAGLSTVALRRRLEQMLSSALKFGTTTHLAPHPDQVRGGSGVPPLRWVYGDDVGNVERMIAVSVKALDNGFPQSKLIEYRSDGNFYNTKTGNVLPRGGLAVGLAKSIRDTRGSDRGDGSTGQAGWRTIARAALFRYLQSASTDGTSGDQGRGRVLALGGLLVPRLHSDGSAGRVGSDEERKTRIFYSRTAGAASVNTGAADAPMYSRATAQSIASSMGDMTPDQEQAYKNVAGVKAVPTVRERMDALKANLGLKLRQGLVDQFAAIKQLDQNAYVQARMSKGTDGTLEAMLMYGKPFMRDGAPDVDVKDGGFAKVLASLKGEQDRWMMWIAAQRAEKLKAEGKENLMTDDDISALKTLNAGKMADGTGRAPIYAKALQELNDYNDAMLKLAMESGLIDQAAYDLMAGQPYVPFYRLMEDGDMKGPKFSSGLTNQKAWQKLKGGTQQLNADLLQNMMLNWSHLLQASAKNRAATATMDAAEKMAVAYKVAADTKGAVKVMRDGSAEHWMVEDPYLLDAISAIHYVPSPLMKPLAKFKQLLTWGVTVNPTFKIRNLIRDSVSAIAQSELGYNPGANVAKGWKLTAKDSQIYASMLASGGLIKFGTQENTDRLRAQVAKLGGVVLDKSGAERLFGQIKDLYDVYNEFGDRAENVNRAALYDALIKKGKTHAEAAFMARDLMDFSMGGSAPVVRFLTQTVPFLNARLVGLDKLGRGAIEDPRRFAAVTGAVALASLALMAGYSDDEDWKKREDWDRDAYWWFKIGGQAYRIPKPFEVGAIGTLAERTAELMLSDEMTGKRYMERVSHMLSGTFSFNPVPQAFKPLLDLYANKDSFTGRAIESQADQRLRPQDRYSERTPEVAKFLGGLGLPDPAQLVKGEYSALSPKQVEHLVRGYFSWVGTAAMTVSDLGLRPLADRGERPDMRLKDVFIAGNFVENLPTGSSRYVTQMYEQSRQVEQAYASYQEAIKAGDTEKAQSIKESAGPLLRNRPAYTAATRQLAEINRTAKRIEADQAMAGAAKRARLTELEQQRQVVAQRVSRLATATP